MKSAEEFVKIWQTSESIKEVAEKCGLTYQGVTSRARDYRARGIPLKNMGNGRPPLDIKKLSALAKSLNGKN